MILSHEVNYTINQRFNFIKRHLHMCSMCSYLYVEEMKMLMVRFPFKVKVEMPMNWSMLMKRLRHHACHNQSTDLNFCASLILNCMQGLCKFRQYLWRRTNQSVEEFFFLGFLLGKSNSSHICFIISRW